MLAAVDNLSHGLYTKSLSSGRGAELVEAERGFFVQLFSELYPLSVTLAGDSSPLGEPLCYPNFSQ